MWDVDVDVVQSMPHRRFPAGRLRGGRVGGWYDMSMAVGKVVSN